MKCTCRGCRSEAVFAGPDPDMEVGGPGCDLPDRMRDTMAINLTEKAAVKVREIIQEGQSSKTLPGEKLYLRLRVVGGGCSGFQHKLDLDPEVTENRDEVFELHGVPV